MADTTNTNILSSTSYDFNVNNPQQGSDDAYVAAWNYQGPDKFLQKALLNGASNDVCGAVFNLTTSVANDVVSVNFMTDSNYHSGYTIHLISITTSQIVYSTTVNYPFPSNISINIPVGTDNFSLVIISDKCNTTIATSLINNTGGFTAPVVDAGAPQFISNMQTTLAATVTPGTGTVISYAWVQLSGPTASNILTPTSANTIINGLQSGTYVYRIQVIDSNNFIATDTTFIEVNQFTFYCGWVDSIESLISGGNEAIEALPFTGNATFGASIPADFRANEAPQILVMAEPLSETVKTKWYCDVFNQGNIGDNNKDLFGTPITIGSYRVYYTNYLTQQNYRVMIMSS